MINVSQYMKLMPYSLSQDPVLVAMMEAVVIQLHEAYEDAKAIYDLVNIDKLPEQLLDLIAYEKHVDFYNNELSVLQKRELIKTSISWHRKKGTRWAVEHVFKILNIDCDLKEWFEYDGTPYFFKVGVNIRDRGINENTLNLLMSLIFESKNLRSHLEELNIHFASSSQAYVGVVTLQGEEITVYPWQVTNIDTKVTYRVGSGQQFFDKTTIFPKGGN